MAGMLATCAPRWEDQLAREFGAAGLTVSESGPGWTLGPDAGDIGSPAFAFARCLFAVPREIRGSSVNVLAKQCVDSFVSSLGEDRVENSWPCIWGAAGEAEGLHRRAAAVERAFLEVLGRRLSRVRRLAVNRLPAGVGISRGWWVYFVDFDRAFTAREAWLGGQRRMADSRAAPSRSYLKIEEAYGLLGIAPQAGERVADLGAAPGGWSFSAARHGARVVAIDNGPLKGGAATHPLIEHRRQDAFVFRPAAGERFDWLFCDLVADPGHVLAGLVQPWLSHRWCRRFVVNLKFGRTDPCALLETLRASGSPFRRHASRFLVRHLFHDREEFTVAGEVAS